jgi:hypothetical protein
VGGVIVTADDITWTTTTADQGSGDTVTVADAGEENPAHPRVVENRSGYGHGGVLPSGSDLAIVRADDGGVGFAAYVPRPSWADTVRDVWSAHEDGGGFRLTRSSGATVMEITGCKTTGGVIIGADALTCLPPGVPGPQAAVRDQDTVVIGGYIVGKVVGSSLMVKIG